MKKTEKKKEKEKLMVTIEVWKWKLKERIGFKFQIKCNVGGIESLEVKDWGLVLELDSKLQKDFFLETDWELYYFKYFM